MTDNNPHGDDLYYGEPDLLEGEQLELQPITILEGELLGPIKRPASDISPKISGSLAAGAVATLTVFVASQFGLEIPIGVEGAIAILVGTIAGYLIPDNR